MTYEQLKQVADLAMKKNLWDMGQLQKVIGVGKTFNQVMDALWSYDPKVANV